MARLKAIVRSALEDRSPRFLLATIALGVVVSLVAGFAIGYKVDNSKGRGSGAKGTAAKHGKGHKGGGGQAPKLKQAPLLIGTVEALKAGGLVVAGANGKSHQIGTGRKTRIAQAETGATSDIKVGSRVVFQPSPTSQTTAVEVIVLPDKAQLGQQVKSVVPGSSMTVQSFAGTEVINTGNAAVLATTTAKPGSIAKGTRVIVQYFVVRGRRNAATDVVVLPKNSKFA
jgi:hypothetical protein